MKKKLLIFLFIAFVCSVFVNAQQVVDGHFEHKQLTRKYIYYAPDALPVNAPLVVVLHGYTSSAKKIMDYSKMNVLADENNFAVVYPQGTKDTKGNSFWNVGYSFHEGVETDDVDYIVKLVEYLQKKHTLSASNTFLTGMSNGGEMCYLMACKHPEIFAATAPIAGTIFIEFFKNCDSNNPIPIFAVFGTNDAVTNYNGDLNNRDGWGPYHSIPYTVDYWAKAMDYTRVQIDTLPDINTQDSSFVVSTQYLNEQKRLELLFYQVVNGGHDWPGAWGNKDINTSQEIWRFFERYTQK